jgi:hypothetical protein
MSASLEKEAKMNKLLWSIIVSAALSAGAGTALAADPMGEKEAKPSIKERITKDAVKGTLMKIEGEYYWIKDNDGKEVRIHVDKSTKLDKVVEGDHVKAFITDKGHTTTLQRQE